MLALRIAIFLFTLCLGIVASTLNRAEVHEVWFSVPAVLDAAETRTATDVVPQSPKASQSPLNCVDAVREPRESAERLKEIDRLRRKVDKLSREIKKKNPLKRDIEILDETGRIQKQIDELERAAGSTYTKSLYREICYQ